MRVAVLAALIFVACGYGTHAHATNTGSRVYASSGEAGMRGPLIAFAGGRFGCCGENLYVVSAAGGTPRLIVHNVWGSFGASWSPDGRMLAVTLMASDDDHSNVYAVGADGRNLRQVTRGGHAANVSWSPDGRLLEFEWTGNRNDGPTWIDTSSPDGNRLRRLTTPPIDGDTWWAAGGDELLVDAADATYRVDVRNGKKQRFPAVYADSWSPSRRRAVLVQGNLHRLDLHFAVLGGRGSRAVVFRCLSAYEPAWAPDGELIAFSATSLCRKRTAGLEAIYVVRPNGTGLRRLTPYRLRNEDPSWSPDSTSVAYVGSNAHSGPFGDDLFVVSTDGGGDRQIAHGADSLDPLTWRPSASCFRRVRKRRTKRPR